MPSAIAFAWGLVAGSALLIGAAIGWFADLPARVTAAVLAFGSGVLISAVAFDLMEEAQARGGFSVTALGFLLGAGVFTIGAMAVAAKGARHRKRARSVSMGGAAAPIAIALGSFLDSLPESMVIGISLIEGQGVALSIVVAVFLSNLPEGLSSAAGMKADGHTPAYVFGVWGGIALLCGLSSLVGYTVFDGLAPAHVALAQAFAAGAIFAMIADTMIPEAFAETRNAAGLIAALGFLLAFVLSHAFG